METSKRAYAKSELHRLLHQCACPCGECLQPHAFTGDRPTLAGSYGSGSCQVTAAFLRDLLCARFYLCSPRLESLFPLVLWKSYSQILQSSGHFLWESQSLCQIPSWEAWRKVQKLHNSGRTYLILLSSSFYVIYLVGMGFEFYCNCAPPIIFLYLDMWYLFWSLPAFFCWWLFNS